MQPDHSRPLLYFARTLTYIQHTFSTFLQHYTTKSDFSDPSVRLPVRLRRFSSLFDVGQCRTVSDHVSLLFITILGHSDRAGIAFGLLSFAWTFILIIALFIVFFYLLSCLHVYKTVDTIEIKYTILPHRFEYFDLSKLRDRDVCDRPATLRLCDFDLRPCDFRLRGYSSLLRLSSTLVLCKKASEIPFSHLSHSVRFY